MGNLVGLVFSCSMDDLNLQYSPKFQKVVDVVRADLATIRTGKATPALIESVPVEAYGAKMKLLELATVSASDPTTLIVTPFDQANGPAIATAISDSNLGLSAIVEDTRVRVMVPALSQERREEYVKLAKTKVEGGKVMLRQVRHEAMEDISKSDLDEDTQKRMEKELQVLVEQSVEKLELMVAEKEQELLKV